MRFFLPGKHVTWPSCSNSWRSLSLSKPLSPTTFHFTASPQFYSGLDYKTLAENLGPLLNDSSVMTEYACPNPDIFRFRFGREGTPPKQAAAIVMLFYGSVEILGLVTPSPTEQ